MIRVLVAIAAVFAVVFALDWLGTLPIDIAISWPGGEMAPPLRIVVVAIIALAALAVLAWALVTGVWRLPAALGNAFRARRRDRGYNALSRGMVAVGAGDARLARRYAGEAARILPREPLVLLLSAQSAQMEGRDADARAAFSRMLQSDDTRLLGLHGLYLEARRSGDAEAARHFAGEAVAATPGVAWASLATVEYQSADRDWEAALKTLDASNHAGLIDKRTARRKRAVLLVARAMELEDTEPERARTLALESHRLAPELVPAAVVAARLLGRNQDFKRASKILEASWKAEPHPDLANAYAHVRPGDSPLDRLKRVRALIAYRGNHAEGTIALARAALDAHEFAEARDALSRSLRQGPSQRVCLMMAELEEAESGDEGRIREWLSRALRAPRDPAWIADGIVYEDWAPVSPTTGRLDAFEWRLPVTGFIGGLQLEGAELAAFASELPRPAEPLLAIEILPPASGEAVVVTADEKPQPPPEEPVAIAAPPAVADPAETAGEPTADLPFPRRPDDPGPDGDAAKPRRLGYPLA
jgi:HemY protein